MNDLKIFQNEEFGEIRTLTIDGEPWFVAKDITDRLKYSNGRKAVADHVDDEDKGVTKVTTLGGNQDMTIINESGVYSLVFGSNMPEAKRFKRWVTFEVLPEIRKTGIYHAPTSFAEALELAAAQAREMEKLAAENAKLLPKAEFFDAVTDSKSAISIGEVAKVLDVGIGQNKLFAFLREKKILDYHNIPYQEYIDRGYFRTIEQKYDVRGEVRISIKTLVFQKGIDYIRRLLQKEE
jgi:prophage antirepressor-like protein